MKDFADTVGVYEGSLYVNDFNRFGRTWQVVVQADGRFRRYPEQVDRLLAGETRQNLSLANKAGLVITGFSKVEIALERGEARALITASDASADGAGKLARKFKAIRAAAHLDAPIIQDLTSGELGLAMGGSNVIHAVVTNGTLGKRFISSCLRLRRYRMIPEGENSEDQELQNMGIAVASTGAAAATPLDNHLPEGFQQPGTEGSSRVVTKSDQAGTDHE